MRRINIGTFSLIMLLTGFCITLVSCAEEEEAVTQEEVAEGEEDLNASASFQLTATVSDCVSNFNQQPFLNRIAKRKNWGSDEIDAFCTKLDEIRTSYVFDTTLTTVTIAGTGQLNGDSIEGAYYIGATGYNLTAIREWVSAASGNGNIRRCMRRARRRRIFRGEVESGFIKSCLEDETGLNYPSALFKFRLSDITISGLGEAAAGLGASMVLLNVPGKGTVMGMIGGAFYSSLLEDPPYAAFLGCGGVLGFNETDVAAITPICLGAEFTDTDEGSVPTD